MAGPATGRLGVSTGYGDDGLRANARAYRNYNMGPGVVITREYKLPDGAWYFEGYLDEDVTLHTSGTTKDTTALFPAGTCEVSVSSMVTTSITTATAYSFGTAQSGTAFSGAWTGVTAGDTAVGGGTVANITTQASTFALRITTTGTPGAGALHVMAYFKGIRPPTS